MSLAVSAIGFLPLGLSEGREGKKGVEKCVWFDEEGRRQGLCV